MKLVGRTLIILLAAFIVIGATMAFAQSRAASTLVLRLPAGVQRNAPANVRRAEGATDTNANSPTGRQTFSAGRTRPDRGNAISLFAGLDLVKNLAIMGLIVALVVFVPRGVQRIRQNILGQGDKTSPTF